MERRKPLQAKTPLARRKPLRPKAGDKLQLQTTDVHSKEKGEGSEVALAGPGSESSVLRRTRLKPVGAAARRRAPEWVATVAAVRDRCRGRCESCGRPCEKVDPHHVFKRGNRIERSVADLPELIAGLCRECHDLMERLPRGHRQQTLEWVALGRYALSVGVSLRKEYADRDFEPWTPLQILRDILRRKTERAA